MSEVLDRIVKCDISIETPPQDNASFGKIMIIGSRPLNAADDFRSVDKYASIAEVKEAGWGVEEAVYKAAYAALRQEPSPEFIYIAVKEESQEAEKAPEEESQGEVPDPLTAAIETALNTPGWYGLALAGAEEGDYEKAAGIIETAEKIFCFAFKGDESPVKGEYLRTFGVYSEDDYANIAWLAQCFTFKPGSETWAYKSLSGIEPSDITTRRMRHLDEENLNYYIACAGKNITQTGKVLGGEWIDVIRFRDWLKNQMQMMIYELFIQNPKIPYLDSGITLVENQMEAALKAGQSAGGVAPSEYDAEGNLIPGYTVTVPKAASLSSSQRALRTLKDCRYTARLAGAIHIVEMRGSLTA